MSYRGFMPALLPMLLACAACAKMPDDIVWTDSERVTMAGGKDFATCTAAAVAGVPELQASSDPKMKPIADDYLALKGPAVDRLGGLIGGISRRGATIQVDFVSPHHRMPDAATQDTARKLVANLAGRLAAQCS